MQQDARPESPEPVLVPAGSSSQEPLILLIDDSPDSIRLLSGFVRDLARVIFATSGAAGIELARSRHPDLILLDVEMPGIDGYEVCRQLKDDPQTRGASVLFVTSHHSSFHEVAAFDAGAVDFLSKPLTPAVVRARVQTHLTLKRQSDTLQRLAMLDGLTGIHNRAYLDEQLDLEWRRHQRQQVALGFALVDIDHFKLFNDHYGHQEGDQCLRRVAQALASSGRRPGEFAARYGGEEFALLLPNLAGAELQRMGDRLCEQIRLLGIPHGRSLTAPVVSASIGLASLVPARDTLPALLVGRADKALYQAKLAGRNRAVVAGSSP